MWDVFFVEIVEKQQQKSPSAIFDGIGVRRLLIRAGLCRNDCFGFLRGVCLCCDQGKAAKVLFLHLASLLSKSG
jgi:hypothetical protein